MSKIMFIGDIHLSPRTPISRKDNYPQTLLNKLNEIKQLAQKQNIKDLVYLGDLFNTRHMTLAYFIKCFQMFKDIDNLGIIQHLIIGNHDILYNNEDMTQESPIQLLLDSNIFENKSFTRDDTHIHLYNYTTNTQDINKPSQEGFNILVGHYFYALGFNDTEHTLSKEQCKKLKYNAYILGHDHTPYEPLIKDSYEVHRPGSLSRGTSQTCQVNRDSIQVLIYDTKSHKFTYEDLPNILPSKDVFKETNLIEKLDFSTLSESLQSLLQDLNFDNSSDIFETLDSIQMDDRVKDLITQYLNAEGVYRMGGSL